MHLSSGSGWNRKNFSDAAPRHQTLRELWQGAAPPEQWEGQNCRPCFMWTSSTHLQLVWRRRRFYHFAGGLSNLAIPIDCFEHLGAVSLFVCTGLPWQIMTNLSGMTRNEHMKHQPQKRLRFAADYQGPSPVALDIVSRVSFRNPLRLSSNLLPWWRWLMTHIDMAHMTQVTVIAQGEWDMVKHAEPSNKFKTCQPKHQPDNSRKTSNDQESSR